MTDSPVRRRVLVVDDLEEIRVLIRRALSAHGYQVDVAATLAEATALDPGGYDAVLVDAHLGTERGLDLIETLMSQDPAAAGRCLVMTGGATEPLPEGVACLTKPFQVGELVGAVRARHRPGRARVAGRPADTPPHSGAPRVPQAWPLLGLARRLRRHERQGLTDFLHDGPVQELAALTLELQMMSRPGSGDPDPRLAALLRRLTSATASLRWLIDGPWPFLAPETQLDAALRQRTAWLLAGPATTDTDPPPAGASAAEVPDVVDVVELMLLGMIPPGQPARAHIGVRVPGPLIRVELTLTAADQDDQLLGDPAAVRAWLDELAGALGAKAEAALTDRRWHARIILPRPAERRVPATGGPLVPAQAADTAGADTVAGVTEALP